jgi:hypothetical protein
MNSQLLIVQKISALRQVEMHATELSVFEIETA